MTDVRPFRSRRRRRLVRSVRNLALFATCTALAACLLLQLIPAEPVDLRWSFDGNRPHRYTFDLVVTNEAGFTYNQQGFLTVGPGHDARLRLRQVLTLHDTMPSAGRSLFAAALAADGTAEFDEGMGGTFLTAVAMLPKHPVTVWDSWHHTLDATQSVPLKRLGFPKSKKSVEVKMSAACRGHITRVVHNERGTFARVNYRIRMFRGKRTAAPREVLVHATFDLDHGRYTHMDLAMPEVDGEKTSFSMTVTFDPPRDDLPEARKAFASACNLNQAGRFLESLPHYERAVELAPDVHDYRLAYARLLARIGHTSESDCVAAGLTDRIVPDEVRAWALGLRFDNALAMDLPEQAERFLAALTDAGAPEATLALRNARLAQATGVPAVKVGQLYLNASRLAPDRVEPKLGMAGCLEAMGRRTDRLNLLEKLVHEHPHASSARAALGRALADDGQDDRAEKEMNEALRLDPFDLGTHRRLVELYKRTGQVRNAAEMLNRMVYRVQTRRSANDRAQLHYELSTCYRDLQQPLLVRRELEKALEQIHPMSFGELKGKLVRQLATIHLAEGKPLLAVQTVEPYARVAVKDVEAARLLADAYAQAGRSDLAIELYRQLVKTDPMWADGWMELGRLLSREGHRDEALRMLSKARALKSEGE